MLRIGFGQQFIKNAVLREEGGVCFGVAQHTMLIKLRNGGFSQLVVRVGEQMKGLHQQRDGDGSIQSIGFVTDDRDVGMC